MAKKKETPFILKNPDMHLYIRLCDLITESPMSLEAAQDYLEGHEPHWHLDGKLSRWLGKLEEYLGGDTLELIDRKEQKVTPKGGTVYARFNNALIEVAKAIEEVAPDAVKEVVVGTTTTLAEAIFPGALSATDWWHSRANPLANLRVEERHWRYSRASLIERKEIDFVMWISLPKGDLGVAEELRPLKRLFLYPSHGPLAQEFEYLQKDPTKFSPDRIAGLTVFHLPRNLYSPLLNMSKWLPRPMKGGRLVQVDHQSTMRSWIAAGLGVGISHDLPLRHINRDKDLIRTVELPGGFTSLHLYCRSPGKESLNPPARSVYDAIKKYCIPGGGWDQS